jgi:hypothetical protein
MRCAQRSVLARAALIGLAAAAVFSCASLPPESIQQQEGYYYGIGSGASEAQAAEAARRDLISNALTASRDRRGRRGERIEIGDDAARGFDLPRLRPYAEKKTGDAVSIAYRIKTADWARLAARREAELQSEIAPRAAALETASGRPLAERILEAGRLLERLRREGVYEILTESGPGSPLLSALVESTCRRITDGLTLAVDPKGGFVAADAAFAISAAAAGGSPLVSLPVRAEWVAGDDKLEASAATGPDGSARIGYPRPDAFRNRSVRLTVSTGFASAAPGLAVLEEIDRRSAVEHRYRHFDDVAGWLASREVPVPGGPFIAGALSRDRRATRKEAPRAAETAELLVDRTPVTNGEYAAFLEDTRSESVPEYWDNPEYNRVDQPVVGVTWEDANRYAAWLSERLGVVMRLPTEDEWEKAARGGRDVIYPWGDQSPADGPRANYSGNGRFKGPAPAGSYESGANAWGLLDMAGNVWQWTSTTYGQASGSAPASMIVKGGSWMDGPADLRISNRRDVDPSRGYVDVGFRLVREVSK